VVAIGAVETTERAGESEPPAAEHRTRSPVSLTFPSPPPLPQKKETGGMPAEPPAGQTPAAPASMISVAEPSVLPGMAAVASELLGCPRCRGTFQVTTDMAGRQMACPHCGGAVTIPGAATVETSQADAPPIVATSAGDALMAFRVKDANKKIVLGDRVVEVRRLTPEEKARRRLVKRIMLIGFCTIVLIATMLYLNYVGLR
jgi:hypothetical protein